MNIVVLLRDFGSFVRSVAIALLAAAAPMFGFYFLLTSQLAPVREPLWSLPTIFIPTVYCCLWLLRRERSFRSASFALKLTLVHAAVMLALLALGWWRNVAVAALFFDSLLLFALLGPRPRNENHRSATLFRKPLSFGSELFSLFFCRSAFSIRLSLFFAPSNWLESDTIASNMQTTQTALLDTIQCAASLISPFSGC